MFKEGRERVEDKPHSGRPSTSTDEHHVTQVRDSSLDDLTIRDIIEQFQYHFVKQF